MKKSKLKGRLRTLASLFQGKTTFNIRSPTHLAFQQRPRESNILGADCIKDSVFCNYFLKSQAEDARNACRSAQRHPPEAGRRKAGDGQQSSSQTPSTSLGGCSDMGRRQGTKLAAPCGHGSHRDLPTGPSGAALGGAETHPPRSPSLTSSALSSSIAFLLMVTAPRALSSAPPRGSSGGALCRRRRRLSPPGRLTRASPGPPRLAPRLARPKPAATAARDPLSRCSAAAAASAAGPGGAATAAPHPLPSAPAPARAAAAAAAPRRDYSSKQQGGGRHLAAGSREAAEGSGHAGPRAAPANGRAGRRRRGARGEREGRGRAAASRGGQGGREGRGPAVPWQRGGVGGARAVLRGSGREGWV